MRNSHDTLVINKNITAKGSAGNRLAHPLIHNLRGEVVSPALRTEAVTTLQTLHILGRGTLDMRTYKMYMVWCMVFLKTWYFPLISLKPF